MSFKQRHPDFAAIEQHIRRAQSERALYLAKLFADGIVAAVRGVQRLFGIGSAPTRRNGALVVKASLARPAARY